MNRVANWCGAVIFMVVLAGCGTQAAPPKPTDRLLGKWVGSVEVNEEAVRGALPAERANAAISHLKQMRMQLEFQPEGKLVIGGDNQGQPYQSEATWELVSADGEKLTLRSVEPARQPGDPPQEKTIDIRFAGDQTFSMPLQTEVAELGTLHFTRR